MAVLLGLTVLFASGLRRLLLDMVACACAWACCSSLPACVSDHGCRSTRLTAPVQIPKSKEDDAEVSQESEEDDAEVSQGSEEDDADVFQGSEEDDAEVPQGSGEQNDAETSSCGSQKTDVIMRRSVKCIASGCPSRSSITEWDSLSLRMGFSTCMSHLDFTATEKFLADSSADVDIRRATFVFYKFKTSWPDSLEVTHIAAVSDTGSEFEEFVLSPCKRKDGYSDDRLRDLLMEPREAFSAFVEWLQDTHYRKHGEDRPFSDMVLVASDTGSEFEEFVLSPCKRKDGYSDDRLRDLLMEPREAFSAFVEWLQDTHFRKHGEDRPFSDMVLVAHYGACYDHMLLVSMSISETSETSETRCNLSTEQALLSLGAMSQIARTY